MSEKDMYDELGDLYGFGEEPEDGEAEPGWEENEGGARQPGYLLQMFLDEMQEIPPVSPEELEKLCVRLKQGDKAAKDRIVEGHVRYVTEMLWEFMDRGVDVMELLSEANLALIDAVHSYEEGDIRSQIAAMVKERLNGLIRETGQVKAADEALAARVNELSDLSVELVQELGREPTPAEIAHRLHITEDEVNALIRMSMDAL